PRAWRRGRYPGSRAGAGEGRRPWRLRELGRPEVGQAASPGPQSDRSPCCRDGHGSGGRCQRPSRQRLRELPAHRRLAPPARRPRGVGCRPLRRARPWSGRAAAGRVRQRQSDRAPSYRPWPGRDARRFDLPAPHIHWPPGVARVNVRYDEWYYENRLWESGLPQAAIDRLRGSGNIKEREGALWFGEPDDEEEDRVVIRANGQPTYFASDLGYLLNRFEQRGFNRVVEVWAADHHGYVPRMKSAVAALGFDEQKLVVILHQMVNLKEGKMSKRAGRFVTLDELIDRVGSDAVRYFYLLRSPDTTIEFDLELAVTQGNENPVYYAQYAHARLTNVEGAAKERHS